jgi:AAA family ATP:ADP antiporter
MSMPELSRTERLLRLFTEVKPGEGAPALLMFANVFLILCAYYLIKPLREGWIAISDIQGLSKMEVKAYSSFGQSLLLLFVVRAYAKLVPTLARARLIAWTTLFCMSNMLVFWVLQPDFFFEHLPLTGIVFYLWVGMFGVFVVAQFWAFAADLYESDRGKRLIPLVAIGATAGAAFGSWLTQQLVESAQVVKQSLLLVALIPLAASIGLTYLADRLGPTGQGSPPRRPEPTDQPQERRGALGLILRNRYLLAVAVITLLMNWVNTNGENVLFRVVQDSLTELARNAGITAPGDVDQFRKDGTTAFYGNFYFWVNAVALFLQAIVASRLLKFGGFAALLMLMPAIALMGYAAMALLPVLAVIKIMKIADNATDYSINNTARHVIWLPVSSETKFKGKPTVDTLFARLGDLLAALTVLVGVQILTLPTEGFLAFTVVLVVAWIGIGVSVVREHARLIREAPPDNA